MAENPLKKLESCGVSVWSDFIRRSWLDNGDFQRLIDEDGISGVTSNPTIFEKAIAGSTDYDDQLREIVSQGITDPEQAFRRIAAKDIGHAADILRPTYQRTDGRDGFVSIEVSPAAAHDTEKTMEDVHYYWSTINRPNIMVKIPGTPEGLPAIEQALSEGVNINITLLFAVEVHEQVIEAYLRGLERRLESGGDISRVASVASFFVSRVDTLTDKLLEEKAANAQDKDELEALEGKSAVNNAKLAYELFEKVFSSDRFKKLADKGARVQKVLWASTSTKNPSYPDTMYVTELVGNDTVNTMPPQTIDAVRDHGVIEPDTVKQGLGEARRYFERLRAAGIDMDKVTDQLTAEGVKAFSDSQLELFDAIEEKVKKLQSRAPAEVTV